MLDHEEEDRKWKKKAQVDQSKLYIKSTQEEYIGDSETLFSILLGLLANSEGVVEGDRVRFKWVENSFEKLTKLVEMHSDIFGRLTSEFKLHEF